MINQSCETVTVHDAPFLSYIFVPFCYHHAGDTRKHTKHPPFVSF